MCTDHKPWQALKGKSLLEGNNVQLLDQMAKAVEISNTHPVAQFVIFLIKRKSQVDICSGYVLVIGTDLSGL